MEAEKLKVIAEGMGYRKVEPMGDALGVIGVFVTKEKFEMKHKYNPLTNDTQCMELQKLVMDKGYWFYKCPITKNYHVASDSYDCAYLKDFNEAVCSWVYEYFKGNNND